KYTSEAVFTPSSGSAQLSQLAGLASQFGVNVSQGQTNESPAFYADLLRSRELLRAAVTATYTFPESSDADADTLSGDLIEFLHVRGDGREVQVAKAIKKIDDHLSVSTDASTGVVTVDVTTRWAGLSRQVGQKLLDLVNQFNLQTRQTQATAERRFLEGRVGSARADLRQVEDSLQAFLEHNRSYQNSPQLQFEYDRLQRKVSLQQQVYTTLAQSLEQAKIDQVRNTPVITVVEPPEAPPRPDPRHLGLKAVLGLIVGGALAVVWAFASEWARRARQDEPEEYRELEEEWADTREDLRRLWRRLRERFRRRAGGA
ncbi:MAG TPA: GNVR domain-containing protein, partial [Gemmatimonadota bacterium]|nr:GNVR domain-containing protein [Gemmatimonadota bacterium]